jgi:hypothetical protein
MDTIPFKLHDPDAMLTETEGLIQLYDDGLLLQFETRDALIGHFKRTSEVHLPLEEISSVDFRNRWYGTSLTVQVRDLTLLQDVRGSKLGRLRLKFKRRYRDAAAEMAAMLEDNLYDLRLGWEHDDATEAGY